MARAQRTTTSAAADDTTSTTPEVSASPMDPAPEEVTAAKAAEQATGGTTLDEHIDAPAVTEPGDAPADTTDPTERASSVLPNAAAAAMAGHLTVNSAVPVDREKFKAGVAISSAMAPDAGEQDGRWEEYQATRPDGSTVTVRRNMDTGEHKVS